MKKKIIGTILIVILGMAAFLFLKWEKNRQYVSNRVKKSHDLAEQGSFLSMYSYSESLFILIDKFINVVIHTRDIPDKKALESELKINTPLVAVMPFEVYFDARSSSMFFICKFNFKYIFNQEDYALLLYLPVSDSEKVSALYKRHAVSTEYIIENYAKFLKDYDSLSSAFKNDHSLFMKKWTESRSFLSAADLADYSKKYLYENVGDARIDDKFLLSLKNFFTVLEENREIFDDLKKRDKGIYEIKPEKSIIQK